MFRYLSFCRTLILLLGSLAALPAAAVPARSLTVAQTIDLSGPDADFARDFSLGAKIYFDHVNAGGGINGHRLNYRLVDSGGTPGGTLAAARGLVREGAAVLLGPTGDEAVTALAADREIAEAGIAIVAPIGSSPQVQRVFPLRTGIADELRAVVAHLTAMGIRSFGIAASANGRGALPILEGELTAHSARLLAQATLSAEAEAPARAAARLAQARPQAVIVLADTLAVAQFVKAYRRLDPGAFLATQSTINLPTLISAVGPENARGLIVPQVVPDPRAMLGVSREHRRLMERYADEPASQATLEGFIAAKALVQALRRARDLSPAGVRQALRETGRIDLGGFEVDLARPASPSTFVELTVVGGDGRLRR